jgi:hypothetical protein
MDIKFATHTLIHEPQWDKAFLIDRLQQADPTFQIIPTSCGLWLSRRQADQLVSALDAMGEAMAIPSFAETMLEVGADEELAYRAEALINEEWCVVFTHTIFDGELYRLSPVTEFNGVTGSDCYDDTAEVLSSDHDTIPNLFDPKVAEECPVFLGGVPVGIIKQGSKYWEFIPTGESKPTLRSHGLGGMQHTIRRWFGNQVTFGTDSKKSVQSVASS